MKDVGTACIRRPYPNFFILINLIIVFSFILIPGILFCCALSMSICVHVYIPIFPPVKIISNLNIFTIISGFRGTYHTQLYSTKSILVFILHNMLMVSFYHPPLSVVRRWASSKISLNHISTGF